MLRTVTREGVVVEECFSVGPEPGQYSIIKSPFHHISVLAVEVQMSQPVGPLKQGDGCAGLCVAVEIWQIVTSGKAFVLGIRADPPRNVELGLAKVLPERLA